jgi:hypothetical protein
MTSAEVAAAYQLCINSLDERLQAASRAGLELDVADRAVTPFEAARLIAGIDGSNEQTRKANLAIALEADDDYRVLRDAAVEIRQRVSDADREVTVTREQARLYRLLLAQSAHEGIQELVA